MVSSCWGLKIFVISLTGFLYAKVYPLIGKKLQQWENGNEELVQVVVKTPPHG